MLFRSVLTIFSSRRLIVSGPIFRSLIHFEFILVNGEKEWSMFILLHVAFQFSQHHLLKRLSFLHCMPSAPLSKIRSEEHTSELQSRHISYAVFCLKK